MDDAGQPACVSPAPLPWQCIIAVTRMSPMPWRPSSARNAHFIPWRIGLVTKSFIVTVLPPSTALSEVLQRRGSCQIIALWFNGHAVAIDLQLAAVFDVAESSPLALPDMSSAAANLIARLTGAHAGGATVLSGAICLAIRPPRNRPPRRRGSSAGRKCKRPGVYGGKGA